MKKGHSWTMSKMKMQGVCFCKEFRVCGIPVETTLGVS
jgi:hypothetical protein